MRSVGQFQAGNYKASGKSRVMWFPSVAAVRAEPRLFELADAIEIDGQGLFYANRLSTIVDDGTPNTPAIKLAAVQFGRFVRAQPYLPSGVYFSAAEDGSDDWLRLAALANAEYGVGGLRRKIVLMPGNYRAETTFTMPVGLKLECLTGVNIVCAITKRAYPPPSPYRGPFIFGVTSLGATIHLTSTAVIGSRVVECTRAPAVGSCVVLNDPNNGPTAGYEVVSVSGLSVTLDRALTYAWGSGPLSNMEEVIAADHIQLTGNGATISGTAERMISIPFGRDSFVRGFDIDATEVDVEYTCSFDTGSLRCLFEQITVRNAPFVGCYLEYASQSKIKDCHFYNCHKGAGFWGENNDVVDCSSTGASNGTGTVTYGYVMGSIVLTDNGTSTGRIINCSASGHRYGALVYGTVDSVIDSCEFLSNDQGICTLPVGANAPTRLTVRKTKIDGTIHEGIYHASGSMYLDECSVDNAGTHTVAIAASTAALRVSGGKYVTKTPLNYAFYNVGDLTLTGGVTLDGSSRVASTYMINSAAAGSVLNVDEVSVVAPAAPVDFNFMIPGPKAKTRSITIASGTVSTLVVFAAATDRWLRTAPLPQSGYTILVAGAGQKNFGTAILTGSTPVSLPWTPTTASSQVFAQRKTSAGTPGHFIAAPSAGVGGVLTGTAGDISTIEWRID